MNNIGQQLDDIRKKLGISQIDLSNLSGIPIATLQRLLWGRTATFENIITVADVMGYEISLTKIPK